MSPVGLQGRTPRRQEMRPVRAIARPLREGRPGTSGGAPPVRAHASGRCPARPPRPVARGTSVSGAGPRPGSINGMQLTPGVGARSGPMLDPLGSRGPSKAVQCVVRPSAAGGTPFATRRRARLRRVMPGAPGREPGRSGPRAASDASGCGREKSLSGAGRATDRRAQRKGKRAARILATHEQRRLEWRRSRGESS